MTKHFTKYFTLLLLGSTLTVLIIACQSTPNTPVVIQTPPPQEASAPKYTQCTDPRPQICTREYRPVCATKDSGIRCVTTPCPSTKKVTYSTGCVACSDSKVFGYVMGACQ